MRTIANAGAMIAETMGPAELAAVMPPIAGDATGKNFLSMHQLAAAGIHTYMAEAAAAESLIRDFRPKDVDSRMRDVEQMANMIPARMAVLARLCGVSLIRTFC